jgi:hypothetical protein
MAAAAVVDSAILSTCPCSTLGKLNCGTTTLLRRVGFCCDIGGSFWTSRHSSTQTSNEKLTSTQANTLPVLSRSGSAYRYHGTLQRRSRSILTRRTRVFSAPSHRPSRPQRPTSFADTAAHSCLHGVSARAMKLNTSAFRLAVCSTKTRSY